jgi:hypothetical protein
MRLIAILLFAVSATSALAEPAKPLNYSKPFRLASMTCFSTGEQTSGMNKICYYDCLGSQAAITVSSVSLCPMSINR